MEVNKFFCPSTSCLEATLYTTVKPKFCCQCGLQFATFGMTVKPPKQAEASVIVEPKVPSWGSLKSASFYRNKEKIKYEDTEIENEDELELEQEGEDFGTGGDPNFTPGSIQEVSFDGIFGNSPKKPKGVALSDIIKVENQDKNADVQLKSNSKTSPKSKRGRPKTRK